MRTQPDDPHGQLNHEYLGDGVYASHDGYQVWLRLNDHRNTPLIALDQHALDALERYRRSVWSIRGGVP